MLRKLLLLTLISPSLWAGSLTLDRAELADWLQTTDLQRAIRLSEAEWDTLTPEVLSETDDPQTLFAQEWVVHKQLLKMISQDTLDAIDIAWMDRWQGYLSQILGSDSQPLFDISESAAAVAQQWRSYQAQQSVLTRLNAGESIAEIAQHIHGTELLTQLWPEISEQSKAEFRHWLAAHPIEPQQVPLVLALLQEDANLATARQLIDSLSAEQLNLYSSSLKQTLDGNYLSLLHYAAKQPRLTNAVLPMIAADYFQLAESQSLMFQQLGDENSGVTSAAMLASYGGEVEWQRLSSIVNSTGSKPSLTQYNALLALRLSRHPSAQEALRKLPTDLQQRLLTQPIQP